MTTRSVSVRRLRETGEGRVGCFLWLLLAAAIGYAGFTIVPIKFRASQFDDTMREEAAFGSNRGNEQIMRELLSKAEELELPIKKEQIEITRTRESITISAHYEMPVSFFGQVVTIWKFDPVVERPLFAM